MKYLLGCGGLFGLIVIAIVGWALTVGGYSMEEPELEAQGAWTRAFRQDNPELSRQISKECKAEQDLNPWTRDGAMELFTCIRTKAEAQGYHYE